VLLGGEALRPGRHFRLQRQHRAERRRQVAQRLQVRALRLVIELPAQPRQHQGEQEQRAELRGEGLGRGDANLGARAREKAQPRGAHQRALRDVADAEGGGVAETLGVLERGHGVRGFAGLGDGDEQTLGIRHGAAVTVLARDLGARRHAGDVLQPIAGDERRVVAGTAGHDVDRAHLAQDLLGLGTEEARLQRARARDHLERIGERAGLLVDLFLHVMPVGSELDRGVLHLGEVHLALGRLAVRVRHAPATGTDLGAVAVLEIHHAPGDLQQRRDVGGGEVLAFAETEEERRAAPGHHHGFGVAGRHEGERERALQLRHRSRGRGEERVAGLAVFGDEMRHDLRIGLGNERIARLLQALADCLVVLNDAVVDQGQLARHVRMCVALGRRTVGGPARVGYAGGAAQVFFL
jgi:hypothetical protein